MEEKRRERKTISIVKMFDVLTKVPIAVYFEINLIPRPMVSVVATAALEIPTIW